MNTNDPLQQFRQRLAFGLLLFVALLTPVHAYLEFHLANPAWAWASLALTLAIPLYLLLLARHEKQHWAINTLLTALGLTLLAGLPLIVQQARHVLWLPLVPVVFYAVAGLRLGNLLTGTTLIYMIGLYTFFGLKGILSSEAGVEITIAYIVGAYLGLMLENHHYREQGLSQRSLMTDPLTGIANRLALDEIWHNISDEHLPETCIGFLLIDLDHFNNVNIEFGHQRGDQILIETARILNSQLRNHDHLSRWGGQAFAVLLPGITLEQGKKVAERMRQAIEHHTFKDVGKLTCCVGLTCGNSHTEFNTLADRADQALYQAKAAGANQIAVHIASNRS